MSEQRLIDANALIADVPGGVCYCSPYAVSMEQIKTAPTIEAVPVVRGEWMQIMSYNGYRKMGCKCSICGRRVANQDYGHTDHYCPKCGAKMDKESEAKE